MLFLPQHPWPRKRNLYIQQQSPVVTGVAKDLYNSQRAQLRTISTTEVSPVSLGLLEAQLDSRWEHNYALSFRGHTALILSSAQLGESWAAPGAPSVEKRALSHGLQ